MIPTVTNPNKASAPQPIVPTTVGTTWLERGLLTAVLLTGALLLSKNQADPDFWGHVRYGQDTLEYGLAQTATYTYTADGHRWINHEIFSEVLFALGATWLGPAALLLVKCALGILLLRLMIMRAFRLKVSQLATYGIVLLVTLNLMLFWSLRPQLFTFVFFGLMIVILSWCFSGWEGGFNLILSRNVPRPGALPSLDRISWLWLLPGIFVLWANTHGGFLAGLFVLVVYLGCRALEAVSTHGRLALPLLLRFGAILLACIGVTLLNPYGVDLHFWLLKSLGSPRPEIVEWRPPEMLSVVWAPFWGLAALFLIAMAGTRRPRDFTHFVLIVICLWEALTYRRHIPFFAITFGFWMPVHVESLLVRLRRGQAAKPLGAAVDRLPAAVLSVVIGVASSLIGLQVFQQLHQLPVRRDAYPVSAMTYMAENQLAGRLVVRFKWAQYAIAAFGRGQGDRTIEVAFDGRFRTCYPQEVVDMYFDFATGSPRNRHRSKNSPPIDTSRLLRFGDPNLVLIDREQRSAVCVLTGQKDDWVLLYQDALAQLWGRASVYDDPDSPDYLPPVRRDISDTAQVGSVPWPAIPQKSAGTVRLASQ